MQTNSQYNSKVEKEITTQTLPHHFELERMKLATDLPSTSDRASSGGGRMSSSLSV